MVNTWLLNLLQRYSFASLLSALKRCDYLHLFNRRLLAITALFVKTFLDKPEFSAQFYQSKSFNWIWIYIGILLDSERSRLLLSALDSLYFKLHFLVLALDHAHLVCQLSHLSSDCAFQTLKLLRGYREVAVGLHSVWTHFLVQISIVSV